jgi:hypothetical protein
MFLSCNVSYNLNIVGFLTFNLLILNLIIIEVMQHFKLRLSCKKTYFFMLFQAKFEPHRQ